MPYRVDPMTLYVHRLEKFRRILAEHPDAVAIRCADENTGRRFGNSLRRIGRCVKIGYTTMNHQIWASWSDYDKANGGE